MESIRHLELLREEGDRLAAMPADHLDAPVPTLPDWTVERVVRHVGKIHQWVRAVLAAGPDAPMSSAAEDLPGMPKGAACLPAYREAFAALLEEFARHEASDPSTTFAGPGNVGFWMRRQAHELAIHRTDAADALHAAGGPAPEPLALDGAADGIDEWAHLFLATRWTQRFGALPLELRDRSVHLHGSQDTTPGVGTEWLINFGDEDIEIDPVHAAADATMRGPADDLLLVLWRRRPLAGIEVTGHASVVEKLIDIARF